jgi:hypothetical protein
MELGLILVLNLALKQHKNQMMIIHITLKNSNVKLLVNIPLQILKMQLLLKNK